MPAGRAGGEYDKGRADVRVQARNAMKRWFVITVAACMPAAASALDLGVQNLNVTGSLRQELGFALYGNENPFNQYGNLFNGRTPPNTTFGPLGFSNLPRAFGTAPLITVPAHFDDEPTWNLMNTRLEIDAQYQFSHSLSGYLKLRAYGDGVDTFSSAYDKTDFFGTPFYGSRRANLLEANGEQWMVDFPAAYLDFHTGPWWVRLGNQQIAWGEAIFFRVLDVVNGLDLRRHSFLDVAGEEYADERVPSVGARISYTFNNGYEIDAFAQKFSPTVLGNENTPYNIIPSQFVVAQEPGFEDADDAWNFGGRLTMPLTDDLTVQVMGVSRRNPDGVFRWAEAGVQQDLVTGVPLPGTPFEVSGLGVYSSQEWFTYAAMARLNGVDGVQSVYDDFPGADALRQVLGLPVVTDRTTALANLDLFFAGGPLRGWLTREYPREEIFGVAANYIFTGEPGSVLDQLVIRGEVTYTPDRKFTNPSLSRSYIEEDEVAASVVLEKYHRVSQAFPATFVVVEWMFKSQSDLLGRHLDGMGGDGFADADGRPEGDDTFNAFAVAVQQPFPNLIWRADLAVLVDVKGGWLIQPGVRYKPAASWQFDLYGNFIDGGGNDDALQTFEWADEIFARVTYYF